MLGEVIDKALEWTMKYYPSRIVHEGKKIREVKEVFPLLYRFTYCMVVDITINNEHTCLVW